MEHKLDIFKKNNPNSVVELSDNHTHIQKLWNDDTFFLRFKKSSNINFLNYLEFPERLSAIYHKRRKEYEIIFAPIKSDSHLIGRKFDFIFDGVKFTAEFKAPSSAFNCIASAFREYDAPSDTDYRNLRPFRDYNRREDDNTPDFVKRYFSDKIPINFFIKGPFDKIDSHINLLKHLDFYMAYFERSSPKIVFFNEQNYNHSFDQPCLTAKSNFPLCISSTKIDDVLLDLIQVARRGENARMSYIFYFQVLEYCAYYFLKNDLKRRLNNIVCNPDLIYNSGRYSELIIEEFKDHFKSNDDGMKLLQLINEFVTYEDIKNEISVNYQYFMKPVEFDGGFHLAAIIKGEDCIENPSKEIISTIKKNIEQIRNVLVHVRESRENKVIYPTEKNNQLIIPYLYLIRRIAEIIAFRYNNA